MGWGLKHWFERKLLTTKILGAYMAKNKNGVILNISSDLGIIAPNQDIYDKKSSLNLSHTQLLNMVL